MNLSILLILALVLFGCTQSTPPVSRPDQSLSIIPQEETMSGNENNTQTLSKINVELVTSKGTIVLALNPNDAPKTVANFVTKANEGYYEGLKFHRVEDWVIQGGDPLGNGTGGGNIDTELSATSFVAGSLGVARAGDIRVSNDSQFFICTVDCVFLNRQYTHFGQVIEGMEVVKAMAIGDTITKITVLEETAE